MNEEELSNKIDALTREIRELRNEILAIRNLLESQQKGASWKRLDPSKMVPSKLDKKTRDQIKVT
jgi:predicted  nucleic acid-binding Zn-ribbon protein